MNHRSTRRNFLKSSFVSTTALSSISAPSILLGGMPSKTINFASVGSGGKGWGDIKECSKGHKVVAVCDVDYGRLERSKREYPGSKGFVDWRKLLDLKGIDAVTISTPDHMHAPVAMSAMDLGLHVYVQKPLAHDIYEARQMQLKAREKKVVTQMGNQGHSTPTYRSVVKLIQSGVIGKVKRAYAWSNRPIWRQGMNTRPDLVGDLPTEVSWDHWLGTAPYRPYAKGVYHAFRWRGWLDFGTGALGDMGCHIIDPVVWALGLGAPNAVSAQGKGATQEAFPHWSIIDYEFPGTPFTQGKTLKLTWSDGKKLPPHENLKLPKGLKKLPSNGCMFHGEKGTLLVQHSNPFWLLPEETYGQEKFDRIPGKNHYQEFTKAILGETKTSSHFDYACPLTETVLLGNLALRAPGKKLEWDTTNLKVTNHKEVNQFVKRKYRSGWEMKGL